MTIKEVEADASKGQEAAATFSAGVVFQDTTKDGKFDTVKKDTTGDGNLDVTQQDTTGDGKLDTLARDTTGDGEANVVYQDTNGDGTYNKVLKGEPGTAKGKVHLSNRSKKLRSTCRCLHIPTRRPQF